MDLTNVEDVAQFTHGNLNLIAGISNKLKISEIINSATNHTNGRQEDIDYGTLGTIMLSVLASGYIPLYRMKEYFAEETIDFEGIYKKNINKHLLTDDRFAWFLDKFYEADPQKIFATISTQALCTYGIKINKVNFDTTSKVMWGEYHTVDGKRCKVEIDFGHSKDKRPDKKQFKIGLGAANGLVVDAKVLSGHEDDKSYNQDNVNQLETLLERTHTSKDDFYYIADSAAFSKKMIESMNEKSLKLITKMPETTSLAKDLITQTVANKDKLLDIKFTTAQGKESLYSLEEQRVIYKDMPLKAAICYSHGLKELKTKTLKKQVQKEQDELNKLSKKYDKRKFACREDAEKEKIILMKLPLIKKSKFTIIDFEIETVQKHLVGRPSPKKKTTIDEFMLKITYSTNHAIVDSKLKEACTFILVSNDLEISATDLLMEYKTQSSVENRFKQLKSSTFVDALYLKTPERIIALTYLLLITLMILSLMEYVVRRGLEKNQDTIIGPGEIVMARPTLLAIMRVMALMSYRILEYKDGSKKRIRSKAGLNDSQLKILKYLELGEEIYLEGA